MVLLYLMNILNLINKFTSLDVNELLEIKLDRWSALRREQVWFFFCNFKKKYSKIAYFKNDIKFFSQFELAWQIHVP